MRSRDPPCAQTDRAGAGRRFCGAAEEEGPLLTSAPPRSRRSARHVVAARRSRLTLDANWGRRIQQSSVRPRHGVRVTAKHHGLPVRPLIAGIAVLGLISAHAAILMLF